MPHDPADLMSKMEGSLQELGETGYWLELLVESRIMTAEAIADLQKENDELTAIFVASVKTAKKNRATWHSSLIIQNPYFKTPCL